MIEVCWSFWLGNRSTEAARRFIVSAITFIAASGGRLSTAMADRARKQINPNNAANRITFMPSFLILVFTSGPAIAQTQHFCLDWIWGFVFLINEMLEYSISRKNCITHEI